jgi:hypothetical protein
MTWVASTEMGTQTSPHRTFPPPREAAHICLDTPGLPQNSPALTVKTDLTTYPSVSEGGPAAHH